MFTVEHFLSRMAAFAHAAVRLDRERNTTNQASSHTDRTAALAAVRTAETTMVQQQAALRADLRHAFELPVHAVPDDELPVVARDHDRIHVRAVTGTGDNARSVRVHYNPAQALNAGTALIAYAAVTDQRLGGTLSGILAPFPATPPGAAPTPVIGHATPEARS